jgi:hypothetical protein
MAAKRLALAAAMAVLVMNVWIGGPVLSLWVGAQMQNHSGGSLTIRPSAALAVFASLAVITVVLVKLLRLVSDAYDRAAGVEVGPRKHDSWVSVERKNYSERPSLTALERILVVAVTIAALSFEVWFFFYSTSPIDQRSGRGEVPLAGQRSPASFR